MRSRSTPEPENVTAAQTPIVVKRPASDTIARTAERIDMARALSALLLIFVWTAIGCVPKPVSSTRSAVSKPTAQSAVELTYVTSDNPPFSWSRPHTDTVRLGEHWRAVGSQWKVPEAKWGTGYGSTLEFMQQGDEIFAWVRYTPFRLADVGEGRLEQFVGLREAPDERMFELFGSHDQFLVKDSHVYLMDHTTFDYWVLFRARILQK